MASRKHTTPTQLDLSFGPREDWRAIPGYEGKYEVSNLGRVRSLNRMEKSGNRVRPRRERILKPDTPHGYERVMLSAEGKRSRVMVHHLVLSAFVGPRPEGYDTNHIDGKKRNNVVHNLEWVTRRTNILHAWATGLSKKGEHHHQAKLTDQQVLEIRALDAQGARRRDLALAFGVKYITIYDIVTHRHWRHLP